MVLLAKIILDLIYLYSDQVFYFIQFYIIAFFFIIIDNFLMLLIYLKIDIN